MFCLHNLNHFISYLHQKTSLYFLAWRSFNYILLFLHRESLFWSSLWLTASPSPLSSSPSSANSPLYLPLIPLTQDMMITIIAKIEQEPELCPSVEQIPKEGFNGQIVCYDLMMMRKKQRLVHTLPNHETVRFTFINEYANNFSQAGNISQSRLEIIQTWVHRNQKSDAISNFPSLSAANSADANIAQTQTHWSIKSSGQLLNSQNVIFSDYCWKYVSGPWTNIAKYKPWTETSWNLRKVVREAIL